MFIKNESLIVHNHLTVPEQLQLMSYHQPTVTLTSVFSAFRGPIAL